MSEWVKSTVALPEINEDVLVHCKNGDRYVAYRQDDDWYGRLMWLVSGPMGSGRRLQKTVTHWCRLPEQPEEEI